MEYRFNAEEWATLSPSERARRCRLMAHEAQTLAAQTGGPMKDAYRSITDDWLTLAEEIERAG
jgi:hypothetical protein